MQLALGVLSAPNATLVHTRSKVCRYPSFSTHSVALPLTIVGIDYGMSLTGSVVCSACDHGKATANEGTPASCTSCSVGRYASNTGQSLWYE
jgi:hypothetical protein